jgi:hypothetical protein
VYFDFNAELKDNSSRNFNARFVNRDKSPSGKPFWTVALDLDTARRLREIVGPGLTLGRGSRPGDGMRSGLSASFAASRRPRTRAGVRRSGVSRLAASVPARRRQAHVLEDVINANQPGVGKTVETIYATIESGVPGPHIVVCPTSLFKDPWRDELAAHLPDARVLYGDSSGGAARRDQLHVDGVEGREGRRHLAADQP